MGVRTSDEDYEALRKSLKKRPFDYFKGFYADTAIEGVRAPMICGIEFFGADHVLFASDCPFDKEKGPGYIRSTIAVLESLDLSPSDREKICFRRLIGSNRCECLDHPARKWLVKTINGALNGNAKANVTRRSTSDVWPWPSVGRAGGCTGPPKAE